MVRSAGSDAAGEVVSLTVRQVAEALRVSTATVYSAVATGKIPHVRIGSAIRIPVRLTPK